MNRYTYINKAIKRSTTAPLLAVIPAKVRPGGSVLWRTGTQAVNREFKTWTRRGGRRSEPPKSGAVVVGTSSSVTVIL